MSEEKSTGWDGLFLMIGFALFIGGGFAFDAGWTVGGLTVLFVGILFIRPVFR